MGVWESILGFSNHFRPHNVKFGHLVVIFGPLGVFLESKSQSNLLFAFFPLDILHLRILLRNVYAQIIPMRALSFQTTPLTHSGNLHEQETCPFSATPITGNGTLI